MKVLFIGHYYENSGWGVAIRNLMKCMLQNGVDLVCRPVLLNNSTPDIPEEIKQAEKRSLKGCGTVIQYVLPHFFSYHAGMRNIGVFTLETHNTKLTPWIRYINMMDEIWCPSVYMIKHYHDNGFKVDCQYIPHTFDTSVYKEYEKLPIPKSRYTFYYIAEHIHRKRISALLHAYYAEFHPDEDVSLIIKTSKSGFSSEKVAEEIGSLSNNIKQYLRMHSSYKQAMVIADRLSDEEMYQLHSTCDCFVCPSYGEAWCIPAYDAMAFNNRVMMTSGIGGDVDYNTNYLGGLSIKSTEQYVYTPDESFQGFNTSREKWYEASILDLREKMRMVTQEDKLEFNGPQVANEFSYENIGKMILEILK